MANQNAILNLVGSRGPRGLRMLVVDTNGADCTFHDLGGVATFIADDDYRIVGIQGQGTTAPGVTALQASVNGNFVQLFIATAAVYDPTSSQAERLGGLLGAGIRKGTAFRLVSRA